MTCWFCGTAEAGDYESVRLQMYGEIQSSDVNENKKRIEFITQVIDIPRCTDCKRKHIRATFNSELSVLMVAVMLAAGVSTLTIVPDWIWGLALGLSVGFLILFLTLKSIALKGIKKKSAAKKTYPEVADLLRRGYGFGKNPSYAESIKS